MDTSTTTLPTLSIVTAVYNGDQFLAETIESILKQTYRDFEFIIIDDGSSDRTWEIMMNYANQDARIKLFKNEVNLGHTESLNKGLKLAQGKYIARQDGDDISLPDRLERQVKVLDENPAIVLVSCDIDVIDPDGNFKWCYKRACHHSLVPWYLLFHNYISGHSQVIYRREHVLRLGGYSGSQLTLDYDLWSRFARVGRIEIIPGSLLKYREHDNSLSSTKRAAQLHSSMSISKSNIERLTGKEITLDEVQALRGFWDLPFSFQHYSVTAKKGSKLLQKWLSVICRDFIAEGAQTHDEKKELSNKIRKIISQQFMNWSFRLTWHLNFQEKFNSLLYAFLWNPIGFTKYWIKQLIS